MRCQPISKPCAELGALLERIEAREREALAVLQAAGDAENRARYI
jgi:hypothetical protein